MGVEAIIEEMPEALENYKIGCIWNNKLYEVIIEANSWGEKNGTMTFFIKKDKKIRTIASFTSVVYFWNLGPILREEHLRPNIPKEDKKEAPKEKTFGEMLDELAQVAKPGELPPDWGKINGQTF